MTKEKRKELKKQEKEQQQMYIRDKIRDLQWKLRSALKENNQEAATAYAKRIKGLRRQLM